MLNTNTFRQKFKLTDKYKPLLLFIVKAITIYYVLQFLFLAYVGLADPRGTYDFTEIFGDFNLIYWITKLHVIASEWVLNLCSFDTESTWKILRIKHSGGVMIEYACLGVEVWIAFIALIFAYPIKVNRPLLYKSIASVIGVLIIFLLNVGRMVAIILIGHYRSDFKIQTVHDIFNYVVYSLIFVLFALWIHHFKPKPVR